MKENNQAGADVYVGRPPQSIKTLWTHGHYASRFGDSSNTLIALPRVAAWEELYRFITTRCPRT